MGTSLTNIVLLCLLLLPPAAFAAAIKATPDRNPVRMNESFNVVFSSADSVDGDPDFRPLEKDFEILGQNQGSQLSIINGKMSRQQEWTLTLSPKHTGTLAIPPIAFGGDMSQAASVNVQPADSSVPAEEGQGGVLLKMEVEPKDPYVQAQVIVTVQLWTPQPLQIGGDLTDPQADGALVERLFDGNGRSYAATRNGQTYGVHERKFALFPQKSGLLHIEPIRLNGEIETGGGFFARRTQPFRLKSEPVDVKVRPIPAEFKGPHWLPVAELSLEESWPQNPPQAKAGEPITRTLTLKAQGATTGLLPELGAAAGLDPSIKQYPDQPALNEDKLPTTGLSAKRQEKAALIPGKAGTFKLPAVEIPWWNTRTDRMEIARIPERILKVEGGVEQAPASVQPAAPPQAAEPAPAAPPGVAAPGPTNGNLWFWLALLFGLGWLATGLAWWHSTRRQRAAPAQAKPDAGLSERQARKALQDACARNDAQAARAALLAWGRALWPAQPPANLAEWAGRGGAALAEEIGRLNRVLYGQAGEDWRGAALWAAAQAAGGAGKPGAQAAELEPLYR